MNKWTEWAAKYSKCVIPANPIDISLCLTHLSHSALSPAPITKAVTAIAWAHKLAGMPDPSSSIVSFTHEGLKRTFAKPIQKKEPITAQIIKDLVASCIPEGQFELSNLMNIRTVTMCVIAYTGFLRFNELSQIRFNHITFTVDSLTLFIPTSKTDVYRGGRTVAISKLDDSPACPVKIIKEYLSLVMVHSD